MSALGSMLDPSLMVLEQEAATINDVEAVFVVGALGWLRRAVWVVLVLTGVMVVISAALALIGTYLG